MLSTSFKICRSVDIRFQFCRCIHISWSIFQTYYDTLNLRKDCSAKDIRESYLELSKEYHPDKNRNDPENNAKFVKINEAYNVLRNPRDRAYYDMMLKSGRSSSNSSSRSNYYHHRPETQQAYNYSSEWSYRGSYHWNEKEQTNEQPIPKGRLSNRAVAILCIVWIIFGGAVQFLSLRNSVFNREKLYEDSHHIGKLHSDIRRQAMLAKKQFELQNSQRSPHDSSTFDENQNEFKFPETEIYELKDP